MSTLRPHLISVSTTPNSFCCNYSSLVRAAHAGFFFLPQFLPVHLPQPTRAQNCCFLSLPTTRSSDLFLSSFLPPAYPTTLPASASESVSFHARSPSPYLALPRYARQSSPSNTPFSRLNGRGLEIEAESVLPLVPSTSLSPEVDISTHSPPCNRIRQIPIVHPRRRNRKPLLTARNGPASPHIPLRVPKLAQVMRLLHPSIPGY